MFRSVLPKLAESYDVWCSCCFYCTVENRKKEVAVVLTNAVILSSYFFIHLVPTQNFPRCDAMALECEASRDVFRTQPNVYDGAFLRK